MTRSRVLSAQGKCCYCRTAEGHGYSLLDQRALNSNPTPIF